MKVFRKLYSMLFPDKTFEEEIYIQGNEAYYNGSSEDFNPYKGHFGKIWLEGYRGQ